MSNSLPSVPKEMLGKLENILSTALCSSQQQWYLSFTPNSFFLNPLF